MNGIGCKNCPVNSCKTTIYRGSVCAVQREEYGLGDPITNSERIDSMTIEEKADFLASIAYARETPWHEPFAEKFCKSCSTTKVESDEYGHPMYLHECDFADGKCPHGSDIVWWLQQPAEEIVE